jgi:transcription termination/antitermination protein NusG
MQFADYGGQLMLIESTKSWHALFVATGEEDRVKERILYRLGDRGIRALVPKRKLRERRNGVWESSIKTLFPGYLLLNGSIGADEYYCMRDIPGIIRILKDKHGLLRIEEHEISILSRLICNHEIIETSHAFLAGGRIVVTDGPLLGMEGFIESIDTRKGRAKVRLNFIGEPRVVDLSISLVQSA